MPSRTAAKKNTGTEITINENPARVNDTTLTKPGVEPDIAADPEISGEPKNKRR
jgi:hypothetical protein